MEHRYLDSQKKAGNAPSGVAPYSGNLLNSIENAAMRVAEEKPRCENMKYPVFDNHQQNGWPCNAANAHLIAAAPDMLEALEHFIGAAVKFGVLRIQREKAEAAIAKASGGVA